MKLNFDFRSVLVCLALAANSWGETPYLLTYQGKLTDTAGKPITTAQTVTLRIFVDGTASRIWEEVHSNVTPGPAGNFSLTLGEKDDLAKVLDLPGGKDMEVLIGGQSMGRAPLTSALFALEADGARTVTGPANFVSSPGTSGIDIDAEDTVIETAPANLVTPPLSVSGLRPVLIQLGSLSDAGPGILRLRNDGNVVIGIYRQINGGATELVGSAQFSQDADNDVTDALIIPASSVSVIDTDQRPGTRVYSVLITSTETRVMVLSVKTIAVEL